MSTRPLPGNEFTASNGLPCGLFGVTAQPDEFVAIWDPLTPGNPGVIVSWSPVDVFLPIVFNHLGEVCEISNWLTVNVIYYPIAPIVITQVNVRRQYLQRYNQFSSFW